MLKMKYLFVFIFTGLILVAQISFAQRGGFVQRYLERQLDQDAPPNMGPAPDYSNLYYWAASPFKHNPSDSIPSFLADEPRDSSVDVFFIYPTSYIGSDGEDEDMATLMTNPRSVIESMKSLPWNADLTDTFINNQTDSRSILYQASVFNSSCRIFAPRYRQANLKAFFVSPNSIYARKAFDLAYSDIKKAFEYYLQHYNHGRPIIIASHSQGTLHAIRLLQDFFDGTPLQKQLVCAYIIGHQISTDAFKQIPVCNSPATTGCFVGWRSYQKGTMPEEIREENGNSVCVNPLTWTTSTTWAPKKLNAGSLLSFNTLYAHSIGAGIEPNAKILWVSLPENVREGELGKMKNLHVLDYNLFWMNIRENVKERIAAYWRTQHG
jgi:Protein of unknown function (DUF3089)